MCCWISRWAYVLFWYARAANVNSKQIAFVHFSSSRSIVRLIDIAFLGKTNLWFSRYAVELNKCWLIEFIFMFASCICLNLSSYFSNYLESSDRHQQKKPRSKQRVSEIETARDAKIEDEANINKTKQKTLNTYLSIPSNEAGWITSPLSEFRPFCLLVLSLALSIFIFNSIPFSICCLNFPWNENWTEIKSWNEFSKQQ